MPSTIVEGRNVNDNRTLTPDFCIIGSGAGGGVCSLKLVEAGFDVLVLEEGPNIPEVDGPAPGQKRKMLNEREVDMYKLLYQEGATRLTKDGGVKVKRITCAVDCGIAINPDLVRAQVEGGLLFGLSAAAWGEVVLGDGGEIVTQNFDRYPLVRMRSVPQIEAHLIESTESPTGVGEVSVPSVAPALANAIAALTATRIRQLPFSKTIKIA